MAFDVQIRDRIKELKRVPASELLANPKNWRRHPQPQQEALAGILQQIGFADAVIARETDDGLELIDGHLRQELMGDQPVPVLVVDVTAEEADMMLATLDPLAAMAGTDYDALESLLMALQPANEAVADMLRTISEGVPELPPLGPEIDESIADGISLCECPECGHEHHRIDATKTNWGEDGTN